MSSKDEVLAVYADAMLPKVTWLRQGRATPQQRSATLSSLTQELRKLCDALAPGDIRPLVSRRAAERAAVAGVDLCAQTWLSQKRFDPARSTFHLEHIVPVAEIRSAILGCTSREQVVKVLAGLRLAWILKEEDAALDSLGYRVVRPDPNAAYAHAGIELVTCHHQRSLSNP
jgi:hypothetical protein